MFKRLLLILSIMMIMVLSSCSSINKKDNTPGGTPSQTLPGDNGKKDDVPPPKETDPLKKQISEMTLDEKIGQMVISGVDGLSAGDNTKSLIEKYKVGGFIILGENVKDTEQLLTLINSIKNINSKNKIPLFMSVDEEGGRISRMPGTFKKLPTNGTIGKINNSNFSYKIGGIISGELKAFGYNMDFAPVLDINSNPKNPVIGDRSFSNDAKVVSSLGLQTLRGLQQGNIIPVVKHFPGHGDTSVDSHLGLPVVNNDLKRLKSLELIPFSEAVSNGADAVMVAHILLSKIDPENPSSMSKIIITDLLRKDLNFNGIVITDDMTMGAIIKNYNIGDAAVKSVNAGCDIILVCHKYQNEISVLDSLRKAVENGTISSSRVDENVYRILKLKQKYNINDNPVGPVDTAKINNSINAVLKLQQ